jgi:hypothetical protein
MQLLKSYFEMQNVFKFLHVFIYIVFILFFFFSFNAFLKRNFSSLLNIFHTTTEIKLFYALADFQKSKIIFYL